MPDIDLGITRLISPPNPAAKGASYNPTIEIKNFGRVSRSATGTIRIYEYARGIEIWRGSLSTPEISPNATYNAQTTDYWTASDEGEYIIIATIIVSGDQNPNNNNLSPVRITVTTLPPPSPPAVQLHAQQHQAGGADEIVIEGLKGTTRDAQKPLPHAARHEKGGTDEIEISGLKGLAADPQTPLAHGNEAHTSAYVSLPALTEHDLNPNAHSAAFQQHNNDKEAHPAHNQDAGAHQAAIQNHNEDPTANAAAFAVHNNKPIVHELAFATHNADPAAHPAIGGKLLLAESAPINRFVMAHGDDQFYLYTGTPPDALYAIGFVNGDVTPDIANQPYGPLYIHLWLKSGDRWYNSNVIIQVGAQSTLGSFIVPFGIQTSGPHQANEEMILAMHLVNQGDNPLFVRVVYRSLIGIRVV
jgi:hypothetical protein